MMNLKENLKQQYGEVRDNLKSQYAVTKEAIRTQGKPFLWTWSVVLFAYFISVKFASGWLSWIFIVPPSLVVALTTLARVNDIGPDKTGLRWQVRKNGLVLTGVGSVMLIGAPFFTPQLFPSWRAVIIMYGIAMTFMTTVNQPPWDNFVFGTNRDILDPPGGSRMQRAGQIIHRFFAKLARPAKGDE